jgi:hypothetical protein
MDIQLHARSPFTQRARRKPQALESDTDAPVKTSCLARAGS